jgi:hypothetical protein
MAVFLDYKTGGIAVVLNRRQHGGKTCSILNEWWKPIHRSGFESWRKFFCNSHNGWSLEKELAAIYGTLYVW